MTSGNKEVMTTVKSSGPDRSLADEHLKGTERHLAAMRRIYAITKDIVSHLEIDEVIDTVLRTVTQGLGGQGADLILRDAETEVWHLFASYNKPYRYPKLEGPIELYGPSMETILNGEIAVLNDLGRWLERYPGFFDMLSPEERGYWRSAKSIAAPLWKKEKIYGLVAVTETDPARQFDQDDEDFIGLFAGIASVAVNNAELYSKTLSLSNQLEKRVEERTDQLAQANAELESKSKQLDSALKATIRLQEDERARIARELHDTSCQLIAGALFELQAVQESFTAGRLETAAEKIELVRSIIKSLDVENRKVIEAAYPSILRNKGLVNAVKFTVDHFNGQYPAIYRFEVSGQARKLANQQELAMFRIIQESLTNSAKHADAAEVSVRMEYLACALVVEIRDDGIGFDRKVRGDDVTPHLGLIGMHDRAESINAQLSVDSAPEKGTHISITVPSF